MAGELSVEWKEEVGGSKSAAEAQRRLHNAGRKLADHEEGRTDPHYGNTTLARQQRALQEQIAQERAKNASAPTNPISQLENHLKPSPVEKLWLKLEQKFPPIKLFGDFAERVYKWLGLN